jgi:GNAT superfamily N-acetyltransferase
MPTTIRRANEADAEAVADIFIAARATMPYLPQLRSDVETRAAILAQAREAETWVAERNQMPVGFVVIDGGWLDHLYVHPSRFSTQTGAKLFRHVAERHKNGFQLWVFQQNAGARRFFERHGCALLRLTSGDGNDEQLPDALYLWPGAA